MAEYLPYLAEYAKTGRSSCKKCKENIPQAMLRMAVVFKSPRFDGKMTSWYHFDCFFERQRPKSVGDIDHFDQLRWEDQEKIKTRMENVGSEPPPKKGRGKSKAGSAKSGAPQLDDYKVEYAKSSRSGCKGCEDKIAKDEVRISKKGFDTDAARMYGPVDQWHHLECFKLKREEFDFFASAESLPGFDDLKEEDRAMLLKELPAMAKKHKLDPAEGTSGQADSKKVKAEEKEDAKEKAKEKEEMKKQSKLLYKYRDQLENNLTKGQLVQLLEHNKQQAPTGKSNILDLLCDVMTFGALEPCKECKKGQLVYRSGVGYECTGDMSEWTKCLNVTQDPERKKFKCPKEFQEEFDFLNKYKSAQIGKRVIGPPPTKPPEPKAGESSTTETKPAKSEPPLKGLTFVIGSSLDKSKDGIKSAIEKLGGKVAAKVTERTAAVIASKSQLKKMGSTMEKAEQLAIQVVPADIMDEFNAAATAAFLIAKKNMAPWGGDVEKRIGAAVEKSGGKSKSGKSMPDKMKLTLKGGGVVDPDSGLEDKAHVLKVKDDLYSVVLGIVDIQNDRNSYYKLQVLEKDKGSKWWVFRSWGRVGTKIGDTKLQVMDSKQEAIEEFVALYEEKTGNSWSKRHKFVKQPGKLYPLDIDYGQADDGKSKISLEDSKSKLPRPVQELVCMLFDVESMKKAMVEFELDLTKMPLGKLSRAQIEKAYAILSRVELLLREENVNRAQFVDVSNQFYTLIPHDFGTKAPPLLDNEQLVKVKLEMLESLLDIEVAYSLMKSGDQADGKDLIDSHYDKLNTKIEVLDRSGDEFQLIEAYVKNTHAATHTQYSLRIDEVFKVARKGEAQRFKPFSKLDNRKLLWHGSRVTNMAGILSQGLRIAPPEAPVTGYMFGKGVYFADMVSKSANYCVTSKTNPTGMMLLCDVALGKMYERNEADYIEKLKKGYHSVKGVGRTQPDEQEAKVVNGVQIPLGKSVKVKGAASSSLLYNEYIVYDVAQVNIKYLLKMHFEYK